MRNRKREFPRNVFEDEIQRMKKLLVLAMVAFGAVMAQAVTLEWSVFFETGDAQKWKDNGATVMIFAASNFDSVKKLIATETGSALKSKLEVETLKTTEKAASVATFYAGDFNATAISEPEIKTDLQDTKTVFFMIFTDSAFDDNTKVYWTGTRTVDDIYDDIDDKLYKTDFVGPATIAEFPSLPEPGILALLALGVAGLALKRNVA